ncbi:MAG: DUF554 domain-containing protein [Candidatus Methanomethylophilus sp.]|nr:DUF554 domain-containing protein [Bacteroidales bacterium]MBO5600170.1 DUF554 domain-containing protein [Methanomethylophilus sp.]
MLGTIVNTACIITGTLIGTFFKKGLGEKYTKTLFNAMGLASLALGASSFVQNMPKSEFPVLFILSLAIGGVAGTALDLDGRVKRLIAKRGGESFANGLISACLLYCIGTFSIVGPVLSALQGDNTFLYTNSTLDFVTSMVFATTYGIGMILAAPILFCWQGLFYLIAKLASSSPLLQGTLVNELAIVGGVLIISSGLSILNIKDCKTLNYIPALLVPVLWFLIKSLF